MRHRGRLEISRPDRGQDPEPPDPDFEGSAGGRPNREVQ